MTPALIAEGVGVRRGGRAILDRVSLRFDAGELTGLVGPNGAGKSTLLRLLAGAARPDEGTVRHGGEEVAAMPTLARARTLSYLPQQVDPAWDYTPRDLLDLGRGRLDPAARAAAPGVPALAEEHELAGLLDRPWSRLSGGERARALLAAVLAPAAPVLLADEPGASLDARHRLDLLRRLKAHAGGRVVVVVLHDLDLAARYCDRLVVLDGGRVALDGLASTVARDPRLDAAFGVAFERVSLRVGAGPLLGVTGS